MKLGDFGKLLILQTVDFPKVNSIFYNFKPYVSFTKVKAILPKDLLGVTGSEPLLQLPELYIYPSYVFCTNCFIANKKKTKN